VTCGPGFRGKGGACPGRGGPKGRPRGLTGVADRFGVATKMLVAIQLDYKLEMDLTGEKEKRGKGKWLGDEGRRGRRLEARGGSDFAASPDVTVVIDIVDI